MSQEQVSIDCQKGGSKRRRVFLRRAFYTAIGVAAFLFIFVCAMLIYNNVSFYSDEDFARRLDVSIDKAERWVDAHRSDILTEGNDHLLLMLKECSELRHNESFEEIVKSFLDQPISHYSRCWKREVDPNWPVSAAEIKREVNGVAVDYKWMLYAVARQEAGINPEKIGLFDRQRWHRRQLTHQVFALTLLRDRYGSDKLRDELLEHLCERVRGDLNLNIAVVDIYIQRATFVLRAGFPQKIRRRWIERIIDNQQSDGGWNDRWLCFTTTRRKLIFDFSETPSHQHATLQAIAALYLVKYRYPEQFGLRSISMPSQAIK